MDELKQSSPLKCISLSELARDLGYGPWSIRRWVRQGTFPKPLFLTESGHMRWRIRDIEAWLEKRARSRHRPTHRGAVKQQVADARK
jgi:predicted DNA-binding transcriptional regulator AlpA